MIDIHNNPVSNISVINSPDHDVDQTCISTTLVHWLAWSLTCCLLFTLLHIYLFYAEFMQLCLCLSYNRVVASKIASYHRIIVVIFKPYQCAIVILAEDHFVFIIKFVFGVKTLGHCVIVIITLDLCIVTIIASHILRHRHHTIAPLRPHRCQPELSSLWLCTIAIMAKLHRRHRPIATIVEIKGSASWGY